MRVAVLGGGILGTLAALRLAEGGADVALFEAAPRLGGLAATWPSADGPWEYARHYHCIMLDDETLLRVIEECGLAARLRWVETRMGFVDARGLYPFSTPLDVLRFKPLRLRDRLRVARSVAAARFLGDWRALERVRVKDWIIERMGRACYETLWVPLLRAKFGGGWADVPAVYIWSRFRKMAETRRRGLSREVMGALDGGYAPLFRALEARLRARGVTLRLSTPVSEIAIESGRAIGVRAGGELHRADAVVATLPTPVFRRLLPPALRDDGPEDIAYNAVTCVLLVLDRPLTPYYWLNSIERGSSFGGVIETTNLYAREPFGGRTLVYLPRYGPPDDPLFAAPEAEVLARFERDLARQLPAFRSAAVLERFVSRERFVEPLWTLGHSAKIADHRAAAGGLYLANNSQVYPEMTRIDRSARLGERIARMVLLEARERCPSPSPSPT